MTLGGLSRICRLGMGFVFLIYSRWGCPDLRSSLLAAGFHSSLQWIGAWLRDHGGLWLSGGPGRYAGAFTWPGSMGSCSLGYSRKWSSFTSNSRLRGLEPAAQERKKRIPRRLGLALTVSVRSPQVDLRQHDQSGRNGRSGQTYGVAVVCAMPTRTMIEAENHVWTKTASR